MIMYITTDYISNPMIALGYISFKNNNKSYNFKHTLPDKQLIGNKHLLICEYIDGQFIVIDKKNLSDSFTTTFGLVDMPVQKYTDPIIITDWSLSWCDDEYFLEKGGESIKVKNPTNTQSHYKYYFVRLVEGQLIVELATNIKPERL